MIFNSIFFLLYFLPVSLLVYYAAPGRIRNLVFLLESIVFYIWSAPSFLPLIALLIFINYAAAMMQSRSGKTDCFRKVVCGAAVAAVLTALILFKYFDYLILLADSLSVSGLADLHFFDVLPLGISYYTFKLLSYQMDVYNQKTEAEKNIIDFSMYVLWFPQILVGPIARYADLREAIHRPNQRCTVNTFSKGVQQFVFGLSQKVILADGVGALWAEVSGETIGLSQASTPLVWLAVGAYSLELYLDFSGFSNMSNGLSRMFGFECKENFRFPYAARSITEFWTRWHISLSEWFRDYIYIPLGGNRKGWNRQIFNLLVVWFLTGIWHSSQTHTNFIIWGLYYFLILLLEKKFLIQYLKKGKVWPHLYTVAVAVVGWGIFACTSENVTVTLLLSRLFCFSDGVSAIYYIGNYGVLLLVCVLFSTPLPEKLWIKTKSVPLLHSVIVGILLLICIAYVVAGTEATALYAGF